MSSAANGTWRSDWQDALQHTWRPFAISRLCLALVVYAAHLYNQTLPPEKAIWPGIQNFWLNPWTYFDSRFFLGIAAHGYTPETTAFFPLYPLLLRVFAPSETAMALCGVLVSNLALALALPLFYSLTRRDFGDDTARRAAWLLAFFPTTVFFSAVYTEAVFFLFLVATFFFVRRGNWVAASACGLLASLTRNTGPLIFLALAWEYWRSGNKTPRAAMLAVFAPLLGFAAVQWYFATRFGGALAGVRSQAAFGRRLNWPFEPLWRDVHDIARQSASAYDLTAPLGVIVCITALCFAVGLWRRGQISYAILVAGVITMHLTLGRTTSPYTSDATRYMMTIFPFTQMLAHSSAPLVANRLRASLAMTIFLLAWAVLTWRFGIKSFIS
ncbi:MAG TPA: mannosyltransferase family protein [Abditibacteriaceae bacterium]